MLKDGTCFFTGVKARSNRRPLFPFCFDICTSCDQNPKAVAIAVRNVSGRRRWSKLDEWLGEADIGDEGSRLALSSGH